MSDAFATFSASLPLMETEHGTIGVALNVRPWNGRQLSSGEVAAVLLVAITEKAQTGSLGLAAQAAHEWLSEHA